MSDEEKTPEMKAEKELNEELKKIVTKAREKKAEALAEKKETPTPETSKESPTPKIEAPAKTIEAPKREAFKPKKPKEEKVGIAYIHSSSNNTIIHITDLAGNTISRVSGGMVTKHSRLKANPTIAMFAAKRAAERAVDLGFTKLYVRLKGKTNFGTGPGSHAAVKSLGKAGFEIISILETTPVPRGGPKKKGGRRGRRV